MNTKYIERWYDLEDECGKIAYDKKTVKEFDEFIKTLYSKYQKYFKIYLFLCFDVFFKPYEHILKNLYSPFFLP